MSTQGKWEVCKDGVCDYGFLIGVNFDQGTNERQIASVHCKDTALKQQKAWPDVYPSEQEAKGNANIIAAAKEMLNALKKIKIFANQDNDGDNIPAILNIVENVFEFNGLETEVI